MSDDTRTLWQTEVGSKMWRMERPDSDTDIFEAYVVPTRDILRGIARQNSHFNQKDNVDTARHEIGVVISQLLKGNVNYLWGVLSPIVIESSRELERLRDITRRGIAKNCSYSIRGLAYHNYHEHVEPYALPSDQLTKKCNTIVRTLKFGIGILEGRGFQFEPVPDMTPQNVVYHIERLEEAMVETSLPDTPPNEDEFREYLLGIRLNNYAGDFRLIPAIRPEIYLATLRNQ